MKEHNFDRESLGLLPADSSPYLMKGPGASEKSECPERQESNRADEARIAQQFFTQPLLLIDNEINSNFHWDSLFECHPKVASPTPSMSHYTIPDPDDRLSLERLFEILPPLCRRRNLRYAHNADESVPYGCCHSGSTVESGTDECLVYGTSEIDRFEFVDNAEEGSL